MTLGEFTEKPLNEALADMKLIENKIHTDEEGNVQAVELKYRPKDAPPAGTCKKDWRG